MSKQASAVAAIQLTKIEHEHRLTCPNCGHPRLIATANAIDDTACGGSYIDDGDIIPGLYETLVGVGLEKEIKESGSNEDDDPWLTKNYDYELLVGECPSCKKDYFVVECAMIDDAVEVDWEFTEKYFNENDASIPPATNYVATLVDGDLQWLVHRHDTPWGVCLKHRFGPFGMGDKKMDGCISTCDPDGKELFQIGRGLLLGLWPELKALAKTANQATVPKIEDLSAQKTIAPAAPVR